MKLAALAVVAAIAVVNVSAADQPALRSETAPAEVGPDAAKKAGNEKDQKEQFMGGPWGGLGWGGGCCGLGGWGGGWGGWGRGWGGWGGWGW